VAVDCGSLVPTLIESELFGYEKGAFTGALRSKAGLFQSADGGTIFLDEIGELPQEMQAKLLRVLQEKEVRPVGSNQKIKVDVRIIAATNRDLEASYRAGTFRKDLYFRLNVVTVNLPCLRDRRADIPELVQWFLSRYAPTQPIKVTPAAMKALLQYDWPGNVRELENCMEHAVALARFDQITVEDLPEKIRAYRAERFVVAANDPTEIVTMDELERRYILRVLALVGGNKSRAAQVLGFDRRTLYRKLERYGAGGDQQKSDPPAPEA
jgi:transcriptional regulator with PAS, ATPase and Fis domain